MNLYPLLLFLHVSAAMALFIGTGVWAIGMFGIARARQVAQVRTLADLLLMVRTLVPASALLVIVAGAALTHIAWSFRTAWILAALASLLLIGPFGTWVIDPRVRRLARLAHSLPDGPLPANLAKSTQDPMLRVGLPIQMSMLFGIIFLMTVKPTLGIAILAMVAALLLGLLLGALMQWRQGSPRTGAADTRVEERR